MVGFGPMGGVGPSDMVMRNTNTGVFEVYDIANNQITSAAPMGQVGLQWSVDGIGAARPPALLARERATGASDGILHEFCRGQQHWAADRQRC